MKPTPQGSNDIQRLICTFYTGIVKTKMGQHRKMMMRRIFAHRAQTWPIYHGCSRGWFWLWRYVLCVLRNYHVAMTCNIFMRGHNIVILDPRTSTRTMHHILLVFFNLFVSVCRCIFGDRINDVCAGERQTIRCSCSQSDQKVMISNSEHMVHAIHDVNCLLTSNQHHALLSALILQSFG
jgi:hypothetical protein